MKHDTKVKKQLKRVDPSRKYATYTARRHKMCKATLPSRHISYHVSILYQAKLLYRQAATKYKRCEWPATTHSAVPGEAVVAWQEIQATMEMYDDKEDGNTQQLWFICFSEGFGISLVGRGDRWRDETRMKWDDKDKEAGGDHSAGFMRQIYVLTLTLCVPLRRLILNLISTSPIRTHESAAIEGRLSLSKAHISMP